MSSEKRVESLGFALSIVFGVGAIFAFVTAMITAGIAILNHANVILWTGGASLVAGGVGIALGIWMMLETIADQK